MVRKATGIVRKVDELGRIVLPVELRRVLGWQDGSSIEIFTQDDNVLLRRYEPLCVFCGHGGPMVSHRGKRVCSSCQGELSDRTPVVSA